MIFKFRVFLQNDPKTDFRVEFRCRKEKNLWSKLPRKNDAKKRGKIMKNMEKSMPKWSAAKKSLRKANFPAFLWILVKFGLPRGGQNRQKIVKVRPKAGSKKSLKKRRFGRPPWSNEVQGSVTNFKDLSSFGLIGPPLVSTTFSMTFDIQCFIQVIHPYWFDTPGHHKRCGGFPRALGPQKDQRSLKKAAMLATNCKLQTGDWKLDAEGLTRRGYGDFFFRSCDGSI